MGHHSPVHVRNSLMPEAHPEDGNQGLRDHRGANTEVSRFLRSPWAWRDDDVVELAEHVERELRPVIGYEGRSITIHLGEEMEEIERG